MSLIDGWFPWFIAVAALGLGAAAVVARRRRLRWTAWLTIASVALLATIVAVAMAHSAGGLIADPADEYPRYINVVAFATFALVGVAIAGWPRASIRRRAVLVAAPLVMAMFAGDQLAIRYGYPPDLRTLLGMEVADAHHYQPGEFGTEAPTTSAPASAASGPTTSTRPPSALPTSTTATPPGPPSARPPGTPTLEQSFHPSSVPDAGELVSGVPIPGVTSGFKARSGYVWLPPAYFATPRPALPVMVWLAGVPGQPKNYPAGLEAHRVFADFARAHHGLAPIMVFADYNGGMSDDRGCIDSAQGNIETYLTKDVPAFIAANFAAATGPAALGIGGFSEGGTCALIIGLRNPSVYGPILSLSGDQAPTLNDRHGYVDRFLGGDDAAYPAHSPIDLLADHAARPATTIYLQAGDQEPTKQRQSVAMAAAAKAAGIPVTLITKPGQHNFDFWRQGIADSIDWLAHALGVT